MAPVPPLPRTQDDNRRFIRAYTQGLTTGDFERLFTRDTPEAYRFFSRHIDFTSLAKLPWHRRTVAHARLVFLAFTLKLTPARRAIYGMALVATVFGLFELANGFQLLLLPHPVFEDGTLWLLSGFLLLNLLVLLEVADRLSLKNDLEIAREIQQAMMRTLVDEGFDGAKLMARLNVQITKHAPASRFITLFVATLDPVTGDMVYVNAGQNPPMLRRANGAYESLQVGGMALGMFDHADYAEGRVTLTSGDLLVMYSDGMTEAENPEGHPFDELGLQRVKGRQSKWLLGLYRH